jgi:DNA-binding CsgD family transcriptional regulator/PAS domain-containing protein
VTSEATALSKLIGDIYDAALDPQLWTRALEGSCSFIGGFSAVLHWHDAATERSAILHSFNQNPHYLQMYFEKYLALDPMFPAAIFLEPGTIHTTDDLVPLAEFAKTRFYLEWCRPQGIVDALAANLERGLTSSALFNIQWGEKDGPLDQGVRRRAMLVVPHFQRAVAIGRLFDQHKAIEAALTETLDDVDAAVFLVNPRGNLVFANAAGEAMLDEDKILRRRNDALGAVVAEADRALRDIFAAAENGDISVGTRGVAVPLSMSPTDRWFAHVLPLTSGARQNVGSRFDATAAVFVRRASLADPTPLEGLAKLYGLTASEIRVMDAVLKVSSVKAIAEMLGVSQSTVKTHLNNVFRKSGTKRQIDLVKLVAGIGR